MDAFRQGLWALMGAAVRLLLWLLTAAFALVLLAFALTLLVLGTLWALVRGRRPTAAVFMDSVRQYRAHTRWPGASGASGRADSVVDVEVRELMPEDQRISRS